VYTDYLLSAEPNHIIFQSRVRLGENRNQGETQMSKLIEVFLDHVKEMEHDPRLSEIERHLVGTLGLTLGAFQEGKSLWQVEAETAEHCLAEAVEIATKKQAEVDTAKAAVAREEEFTKKARTAVARANQRLQRSRKADVKQRAVHRGRHKANGSRRVAA
jgi:hypothetical protein